MRRTTLVIAVALLGCAPDQGGGTTPTRDTGGDITDATGETPPTGCDAATCTSRCAEAGFPSGSCTPSGACTCADGDAGTPAGSERCGDGLDNNLNGAVDEGCGCVLGETQPCYGGPAVTRGRGICVDGSQPCIGEGEFAHWGECTGDVRPQEEICDGVDNDCDLALDEGCGECVPSEWGAETICDDGLDNDCDGLVDCFDPDCPPCCGDEICGNGIDDNCDGAVDEFCDDPCAPFEMGPIVCRDGLDNDCDGRVDCLDLQCLPFCCTPENCGNVEDDDCDGRVDCDDTDCCTEPGCDTNPLCGLICCVPGTTRWCDTPTYCSWGVQDCRPDGRWGTCEETTLRPPGCEDAGYYYSPSCCVESGECCQNFGHDGSLPSDASIGDCEGISSECP